MYNIKYHIASLVAVFLAIALGLVLGGLVVRQGAFDQQQKAIVDNLRKQFNSLKKQNTKMKSALDLERGYSLQMTNAWTAGRLGGLSVVVTTSGAKGEGADAAAAAIRESGGTPVVVTFTKPRLGLDETATADVARAIVGTSTELQPTVAKVLVSEWSTAGGARPLTDALAKAGAMTVEGLAPSAEATQAVDTAAADGKPDEMGLEIAQAYANAGMYALGAQTGSSKTGVASAAAARKLSAFDTLGTSIGKFTLVALFTGGQQGYYSSAGDATSKYPPVPVP